MSWAILLRKALEAVLDRVRRRRPARHQLALNGLQPRRHVELRRVGPRAVVVLVGRTAARQEQVGRVARISRLEKGLPLLWTLPERGGARGGSGGGGAQAGLSFASSKAWWSGTRLTSCSKKCAPSCCARASPARAACRRCLRHNHAMRWYAFTLGWAAGGRCRSGRRRTLGWRAATFVRCRRCLRRARGRSRPDDTPRGLKRCRPRSPPRPATGADRHGDREDGDEDVIGEGDEAIAREAASEVARRRARSHFTLCHVSRQQTQSRLCSM